MFDFFFINLMAQAGCWENTTNLCESPAPDWWFASFGCVLPLYQVGYCTSKSTEKVVYYYMFTGAINDTEVFD